MHVHMHIDRLLVFLLVKLLSLQDRTKNSNEKHNNNKKWYTMCEKMKLLQADAEHNVKSIFQPDCVRILNFKMRTEPEGTMDKSIVDNFNAFPFD